MTHSTPFSQHRNIRHAVPESRERHKSATKAGGYHRKEEGVMQLEFYLVLSKCRIQNSAPALSYSLREKNRLGLY